MVLGVVAQTDQPDEREPVQIVLIGWLGLGVRRNSEVEQMFQPFEFGVFRLLILFGFFTDGVPILCGCPLTPAEDRSVARPAWSP